MSSYQELGAWLEAKRIGSYFQNPEMLVIANENPAWPNSNSCWVTLRENQWYLVTWSSAAYAVPPDQNIGEICESIFRSATTAIYQVDMELAERFKLRRLKDAEMVKAGIGGEAKDGYETR